MAHCFFIGIGGTGAKCAEALIHLSAAGLGPDSCTIMLVDQDEPNGNGERCQRILGDYISLREQVRDPAEGGLHAGALFRTNILAGKPWRPTAHPGITLAEICGYEALATQQKDLMDCLYLPKEREQKLDKGFRAHSSVGAAVLVWQTLEAEAFWHNVIDSIHRAHTGEQVRVFLLGSIFGGTGAAGFPTIARLIRQAMAPADQQGPGNAAAAAAVQIGGALMLPYFAFPPPPPARSSELLPDSSAFLEQTRGALTYYVRLLGEQRLFDRLYLVGWQPLLEIGPYREGGHEQNNPALLPELYAALAALQYFAMEGAAVDDEPVSYFTTANTGSIDWNDLPPVREDRPHEVRESLGKLIRLAIAYHTIYRPVLSREGRRAVEREAWFRRLIGRNGALLADPASQRFLNLMDGYCVELLRWAASLVFGAAASAEVELYQAGQFARRIAADTRFERAELLSGSEVDRRVFGALIEGEEGPDLPTIFDRLTYDPRDDPRLAGRDGLGVFLRALHQACNIRHA